MLAEVSRQFIDLDSSDFYSDLSQLTRDDGMEQDFVVNVPHLKSSEETYAFEAIATVGAIARHLSWSKYQNTLMSFLAHLPRYAGQERYLLGAICAVLDSFHFDTSTRSNMLPMDKQASKRQKMSF